MEEPCLQRKKSPAQPDGLYGRLPPWRTETTWIAHVPTVLALPAIERHNRRGSPRELPNGERRAHRTYRPARSDMSGWEKTPQHQAAPESALQIRAAYKVMQSISRVLVRKTGAARGESTTQWSVEAVPCTGETHGYSALAPAFETREECARTLGALFDQTFEESMGTLARLDNHGPGSGIIMRDLIN